MTVAEQVEQRVLFLLGDEAPPPEIIKMFAEESLLYARSILREGADREDPRIAGVAAAYCACCSACGADSGPRSFTAGDVRVDCPDAPARLEEQLKLALEGAADLLRDGSFLFQAVEA